MPRRLQRVLGYQGVYSAAGPGMVDMRDPLLMLDKVRFGYNPNDPTCRAWTSSRNHEGTAERV